MHVCMYVCILHGTCATRKCNFEVSTHKTFHLPENGWSHIALFTLLDQGCISWSGPMTALAGLMPCWWACWAFCGNSFFPSHPGCKCLLPLGFWSPGLLPSLLRSHSLLYPTWTRLWPLAPVQIVEAHFWSVSPEKLKCMVKSFIGHGFSVCLQFLV